MNDSEMVEFLGEIRLIDDEAVAKKLAVKVSTIEELTRNRTPEEKRIPFVKIGRFRRYNSAVIDEWIRNGCRNKKKKTQ